MRVYGTAPGKAITFVTRAGLSATVITGGIQVANGVVHIIDSVLMPPPTASSPAPGEVPQGVVNGAPGPPQVAEDTQGPPQVADGTQGAAGSSNPDTGATADDS